MRFNKESNLADSYDTPIRFNIILFHICKYALFNITWSTVMQEIINKEIKYFISFNHLSLIWRWHTMWKNIEQHWQFMKVSTTKKYQNVITWKITFHKNVAWSNAYSWNREWAVHCSLGNFTESENT